ncbi:MAG TPA: N-acetyl-gamma-glutamyl-phosphate reductase [Actinomycetota bacterium]|nr:N-acetyl-gamma-glutamyl-phosphate reductase [Actinomycetota bacterium]
MGEGRLRVAVFGASGYAGGELVRLLAEHPNVELGYLAANESAGRELADIHPHLAAAPIGSRVLAPLDADSAADRASFAFLSLPHGASASLAPSLLEAGLCVVDLAGDFRLPAAAYPDWYGFEHPAPAWLEKAVYGLPEVFGDEIAGASLVANPGCYPTPVVLGLAPLRAAGMIGPGPILVDGKAGLSGAGRALAEATSYAATEESVRPYRFPMHQHTPEMERALELASGIAATVSFVPHLVPAVRGVLVTCYVALEPGTTTDSLTGCLASAYTDAPFVRVLPPGDMADTKRTRVSNLVELQAVADPRTGTAVVAGALDNLVKGAAGQAVQNMNLMSGFDSTAGLTATAMYP